MVRRNRNPLWSRGFVPLKVPPAHVGEFEEFVHRLGLAERDYVASAALRTWCAKHKNRCYIPEWLLKQWGMDVDTEALEQMRAAGFRRNLLT
jgi:hypothetical protein